MLYRAKNFYGIDTNKFGLELAKVALSIGRKISADECNVHDPFLPFDDLENNFSSEDALFAKWPKVSVIIGNPPFLSSKVSVKNAYVLKANRKPKRCFQGQISGSSGFYLSKKKYKDFIKKNKKNAEVMFPFFVGRDLMGNKRTPERFVIDFGQMNLLEVKKYKDLFQYIKNTVLLDVEKKAKNEDILGFLLHLNKELYVREEKGQKVIAPGLSRSVKNPKEFISKYCIKPSKDY